MKNNEKAIELLRELETRQFTGNIRLNFNQGGITKMEKNEEMLKKARPQK
ncbi:MAG: hypothetical protein PHD01_07560 [Geobacteraceae bacterium]|nr:hypothetical protein [Geobacteraceae bacterium]